jgi:hypothetical protein
MVLAMEEELCGYLDVRGKGRNFCVEVVSLKVNRLNEVCSLLQGCVAWSSSRQLSVRNRIVRTDQDLKRQGEKTSFSKVDIYYLY